MRVIAIAGLLVISSASTTGCPGDSEAACSLNCGGNTKSLQRCADDCAVLCGDTSTMGPGSGPWTISDPEEHGLSRANLERAAASISDAIAGRRCFLAIKNGEIVHEEYYRGWDETATFFGMSTTKTHCGTLFNIAVQQGWADVEEKVGARLSDTRFCNPNATWKHVLTMTGENPDEKLDEPDWTYDFYGERCLELIVDFVEQNNPEGLSAVEFKDKYWQNPLGLEYFTWDVTPDNGDDNLPHEIPGKLQCGSSFTGCRDLARTAQFWLNNGAIPGVGQVGSREFHQTANARAWDSVTNSYGYTVWLNEWSSVDPESYNFLGILDQCAHISHAHDAIVVSQGIGLSDGSDCFNAWLYGGPAMVSNSTSK